MSTVQTFAQYKAASKSFGCSIKDRDDWLVVITRTRDSECLEESNFTAALKLLGSESDTVEIVRLGHWACGWIEHIFAAPEHRAACEDIQARLDDYPVLDEDDFSQREGDAAFESWVSFGCREFAEQLQNEFDLMDSTVDLLRKSPGWTLYTFENSEPYALCTEGDSVNVRVYGGQTQLTRDQLASTLRKLRSEIRSGCALA
jgi:hypothetical protein